MFKVVNRYRTGLSVHERGVILLWERAVEVQRGEEGGRDENQHRQGTSREWVSQRGLIPRCNHVAASLHAPYLDRLGLVGEGKVALL